MTKTCGKLYRLSLVALLLWQPVPAVWSQTDKLGNSKEVSISNQVESGLSQITFSTANGNVIAILPAEIAAGDNIWGTVVVAPAGQTAQDRKTNINALKQLLVQLKPGNGSPVVMAPGCKPQVLHVPNGCSEIHASLYNPSDKSLNTYIIDCLANRPDNSAPDGQVAMPQVATPKRYFRCGANTDGSPGKAGCTINNQNCPAVAGGPRNQWFVPPKEMPSGQSPIKVYLPDKNQVAESQLSMVQPKIYADKLLHVGDRGQIKITVDGLKPGTDAQLIFRNLSPQTISVDGGDYQVIPLSGRR